MQEMRGRNASKVEGIKREIGNHGMEIYKGETL
jgi:hypothetical protein